MSIHTRSKFHWSLVVSLVALLTGCGGDDPIITRACSAEIAGECVGLPTAPLCESDFCSEGVSCGQVLEASGDGELQDALGRAGAGDCIALAPGDYQAVTLPAGVSLLGRDADAVKLAGLSLTPGDGSVVRGMEVAGGIDAGSATNLRVEAVRIAGGPIGLRAAEAASVSLVRSEIGGAQTYGVLGSSATSVALDHSIVSGAGGPGIWVSCDLSGDGCGCASKTSVALHSVLSRDNSLVGLSLVGAAAEVDRIEIRDTREGANFKPGAGMSVSGCSDLRYGSISIGGMRSYGMLVDNASGGPSTGAEAVGIVVVDTRVGIWLQRISASEPQELTIQGAELTDVRGAALGFDRDAKGIVVVDTLVANTLNELMVVDSGGSADVGVGVMWKGTSAAVIDGLSVSGSAGPGLVIDGAVADGSSVNNLTLAGGDELDGVVQQQVGSMDLAPTTDGSVSLMQTASLVSEVPVGPDPPAAAAP